MTASPIVIAIDGPVAAGKGTLARQLAARYDYAYLDTGSLYRAVGSKVLREGGDPAAAAAGLTESDLAAGDLRSEAVGLAASKVAALPEVRAALLDYQRRFAAHPPGGKRGAVLDGRDIGTVVCPDAAVKLFVTASDEVRARRRHKELMEKGDTASFEQVLADLRRRDEQDRARATAPLKPAEDAHLLDTSDLAIEAAVAAAAEIVAAALKR
ncbi:MAG TPA: d(CMP) kinase [Ferrovibrio sp.]|jgi:cytidylate kinase|uniref:(d)CMP kinase n=1 Tax=Ferrovibrio sp. TaxID=1917215 RepID=UPI002B4B1A42|nr:d(CMP) kinase [Ferrovibrio sp.]HLT77161.1 d(CMP) kinase [Ferrovibrio sp.]